MTLGGGISVLDSYENSCAEDNVYDTLIMCLIILVPFIPGMYTVEILRFVGSVVILPVIGSWTCDVFFKVEKLLFLFHITLDFSSVHGLRSKVCTTYSLGVWDLSRWLWCFGNEMRVGDGTA